VVVAEIFAEGAAPAVEAAAATAAFLYRRPATWERAGASSESHDRQKGRQQEEERCP
jgi:hypothetical protein